MSPNHELPEQADTMTYVSEDGEMMDTTIPKKRGKKKGRIQPEIGDEEMNIDEMVEPYHQDMTRLKPLPTPKRRNQLQAEPPPSFEEEEELLEKAEMERLRNKQRLRELRKKERSAPRTDEGKLHDNYRKAQRQIDAVLGVAGEDGENTLPEVFVHKPKKRSSKHRKQSQEGYSNEAFSDDQEVSSQSGESLEEAKKRMHKLLDDAFSLISSSYSSIGNKVTPISSPVKSAHLTPVDRDHPSYNPDTEHMSSLKTNGTIPSASHKTNDNSEPTEKIHTPMFVNPTYSSRNPTETGLETWSPYRAADEVALISLPQTQTVLGKTPTQEKLHTTTFNESYPTSLRDNYYTTEPAKPIVIKTKDLIPNDNAHSKNVTVNGIGSSIGSSTLPNGDVAYPGMEQFQEIPSNGHVGKSHDKIEMKTFSSESGGPVSQHNPPHGELGGEDKVITQSLQPGASPQPLIRSLRKDLEHLSGKAAEGKHKTDSGNVLA